MNTVYPGKLLGRCTDMAAGEGTYAYLGKIYANKSGDIKKLPNEKGKEGDPPLLITVIAEQQDDMVDEGDAQEPAEKIDFIPREGDTVFGRVQRVDDRYAKLLLLAKNGVPLPGGTSFSGILFKEHVRDFDRDTVVMHKCFAPNDIVAAKVIQAAMGGGSSVQCSTALSDDLGVKYAWS